ncbi:MAG: lipopolysaccharide heptosyltransferase II [Planctomycetes bacterium]|nr:lipopolysaccharide heptosyltransferase II [Planctomycetota bacterium]
MPPLPTDISTLLIICPSWVGDTVMATPVLRAIRVWRPEARLVVAMRSGLDELLDGCPWIDERVPMDMRGLLGPWRCARRLRTVRADAVLVLPNSFRSALTARLAGIPVRIGYERDGRRGLLTERLAVERSATPTPMVDYFARLASFALHAEIDDTRLELAVTDDQRAAAAELLDGVDEPFAVLNPGANDPAKRWPAERVARVADALRNRHGLRCVVSGSPGEHTVLEAVVAAAETDVENLAARGITLGSLKGVVERAALMITNDTGPRHIAAALGTPTVALFGPTDHRWTTLNVPCERLLLAEPFLPEELIADRHARLCTIDRISVEDVLAAAAGILNAP